jgi:NADPH-dependent 2,4-dienoyl-CoA reductase/sulfur reductase-like enzyme
MISEPGVVVVGAGAAGDSAAKTLRAGGYTGTLTVVHHEDHPPYNRTLVNKAVLQGLLTGDQIALPRTDTSDVRLVRAAVASIDLEASALVLDNGERVPYSALVAATGSAPRAQHSGTDQSGADEAGRVLHIHTVEDANRIRASLGDDPGARSVTLLGAGFIGAETASYLAEVGAKVHLVSRPTLPLAGVLGEAIARRVTELHEAHVSTHFGREVVGISAGADSLTVSLDDGQVLESDLAVVAHGTAPFSAWATGAEPGIAVDDRLRAGDLPRVYAAGSVAVHSDRTGRPYRVDHWDAATAQGAHAARTLLHDLAEGQDPGPYAPSTGFTLRLYGHAISAYGVAVPGAVQRQQPTGSADAVLTTFHHPADGALIAAAGLGAGREILALRPQLVRP